MTQETTGPTAPGLLSHGHDDIADAMRETLRRWPNMPVGALAFFAAATGLTCGPLDDSDATWAAEAIQRMGASDAR